MLVMRITPIVPSVSQLGLFSGPDFSFEDKVLDTLVLLKFLKNFFTINTVLRVMR